MSLRLNNLTIAMTFVVMLLLAAFENPFDIPVAIARMLEPDWFAIICFYWATHRQIQVPPIAMWLMGLLMDALTSTPFGVSGITAALAIFIGYRIIDLEIKQRFLLEVSCVTLLVILSAATKSIVFMFTEFPVSFELSSIFLPILSSALMWMVVSTLLDSASLPDDEYY